MLNSKIIEDVGEFKYLGSIVSCTGETEEDIRARRKKAYKKHLPCYAQYGGVKHFV